MARPIPTPRRTLAVNIQSTDTVSSSPSLSESLIILSSPSTSNGDQKIQSIQSIISPQGINNEDDEETSTEDSSQLSSPASIRVKCKQMTSSLSSDSGDDSTWDQPSKMDWRRDTVIERRERDDEMIKKMKKEEEEMDKKIMNNRLVNEYHVHNIVPITNTKMTECSSSSSFHSIDPSSLPTLTLLEQIVRSHPIWYLQDIGRSRAEHLLRPMQSGTFLVRSCSRPSAMALSIRLPSSFLPTEIDHLLLVHSSPIGLRLQSSPNTFRSLPLLLEHYCTHKEELRVLLHLPLPIIKCTTTSSLQALALMGIDFWSSPLCMDNHRSSSTRSSSSFSSSSSSLRRDQSLPTRKCASFRDGSTNGKSSDNISQKSSIGKSAGGGIVKLLSQGKEALSTQLANCALFLPLRRKNISNRESMNIRDWREGRLNDMNTHSFGIKSNDWTTHSFKSNHIYPRDHSIDDRLNSIAAKRMAQYSSMNNNHNCLPSSSSSSSIPFVLRPPIDALDDINTKQCVEELRRKRLQSREEMMGSMTNDECSTILRRKKSSPPPSSSSYSSRHNRLSVPSFNESIQSTSHSIIQSAKALKERMDKNEDGALSTINEGLITPVIRRKGPLIERQNREKNEQPIILFNKVFAQSDRLRPSPSSSDRTPTVSPSTVSPSVPTVIDPPSSQSTVSPPSSSLTAPVQWSAITKELRSRQQKVAKVLPTPQTPRVSLEQRMTIRDSISTSHSRNSDYALLSQCQNNDSLNSNVCDDDCISVAGTIFDEPWDSNTWENLLVCAGEGETVGRVVGQESIIEEDDDIDNENISQSNTFSCNGPLSPRPHSRAISHHSLLSMDTNGSLRRPSNIHSSSHSIQQYITYLATAGGTFAESLNRFIVCVKESNEKDSRLLAKNVRQFMNGMKNYLMKAGEGDLHSIINRESARLDQNTVLNMDTILEDSLNRLVLKPLCEHIYHSLRSTQRSSPNLVTLFTNIEKAKQLTPYQLGLSSKCVTPSCECLDKIRSLCKKMQSHYSPHRKLELLLKATSLIFSSQSNGLDDKDDKQSIHPSAQDLVSWLVWLISRTLNVACEVESLYMNELLPVQLRQSGDGGLYLSSFDSAIRILSSVGGLSKLTMKDCNENGKTNEVGSSCLIKVAVPNELLGCVNYESFPLVGDTTAVRLCRLIAHQHSITNPQDYGLYLLTDGFESCLSPSDVIEDLRQTLSDKPFLLAYKRHEARLAWPSLSSRSS